MPAEKTEAAAYSKTFAPIASLVRVVRTLAVSQGWHKIGDVWFRGPHEAEGETWHTMLDHELWELAEADRQLAGSLATIAATDPKFRNACESNSLPLPK